MYWILSSQDRQGRSDLAPFKEEKRCNSSLGCTASNETSAKGWPPDCPSASWTAGHLHAERTGASTVAHRPGPVLNQGKYLLCLNQSRGMEESGQETTKPEVIYKLEAAPIHCRKRQIETLPIHQAKDSENNQAQPILVTGDQPRAATGLYVSCHCTKGKQRP